MSKRQKSSQSTGENLDEAARIARGTQQMGQTREQTRIITRGIRKGIEQYKKQHKAKLRELDRNRKKARRKLDGGNDTAGDVDAHQLTGNVWKEALPWFLLGVTWIGIGVYIVVMS